MQFCMFHDRIYLIETKNSEIPLALYIHLQFSGHGWKLADDNTIDYQWLLAAFSSNNLSTSCVLPIQNLSRNLRTMMIPSSPLKLLA